MRAVLFYLCVFFHFARLPLWRLLGFASDKRQPGFAGAPAPLGDGAVNHSSPRPDNVYVKNSNATQRLRVTAEPLSVAVELGDSPEYTAAKHKLENNRREGGGGGGREREGGRGKERGKQDEK